MDSPTDSDVAISPDDVDGSILRAREPVILDALFSKAVLYRIAKHVIDQLQKVILRLQRSIES